jgi:hypothetical protein
LLQGPGLPEGGGVEALPEELEDLAIRGKTVFGGEPNSFTGSRGSLPEVEAKEEIEPSAGVMGGRELAEEAPESEERDGERSRKGDPL